MRLLEAVHIKSGNTLQFKHPAPGGRTYAVVEKLTIMVNGQYSCDVFVKPGYVNVDHSVICYYCTKELLEKKAVKIPLREHLFICKHCKKVYHE